MRYDEDCAMPPTVELYFDYLSPYAYLAHVELEERAARSEITLLLRPTLLAALLEHGGQLGPAEIPAKRRYIIKDAMRIAASRDLPLCFPRPHPFRPLTALRLSLDEVSGEAQPRVVAALWKHGWAEGGDMSDEGALAAALDRVGLDGSELVARTGRDEAKQALRRQTERAIERGVFGVPTMIASGELFWGSDRVDHALARLAGSDPLAERRAAQAVDEAIAAPLGVTRRQGTR
jgi:2-hydroxychromene-2-carboxylate isomerase